MTDNTNPTEPQTATQPAPHRARAPILKPLAGALVLIVIVLWSIGVFHSRTAPGQVEFLPGLAVPPGAPRFTTKFEPLAPRIDVIGTVASETRVNLSARIPAYVKAVFVDAGSQVRKGQELITLDDREIAEQVTAAEAQFKQAEAEFNRARQLFDNKATTEQALTAAQSMFTSARAQLDRSKILLTYAQICSPIDGVITERRIEPGDLANPGQPLLAVYDPAKMQLEAPVPVRLLAKLPVGQTVEITLDRPATNFPGLVRQIVSEIDPLSRTQLVKVHIDNTTRDLLPGTFGRLWVDDDPRPTLLIPATAVYSVGQLELVQVVQNQRALRRAIRTGARHGASVEALSGLQAGDVVLVNPIQEN